MIEYLWINLLQLLLMLAASFPAWLLGRKEVGWSLYDYFWPLIALALQGLVFFFAGLPGLHAFLYQVFKAEPVVVQVVSAIVLTTASSLLPWFKWGIFFASKGRLRASPGRLSLLSGALALAIALILLPMTMALLMQGA